MYRFQPLPPRPTPAFTTTSFTTLNTSYHNGISSPISYMFQNPVLSPSLHIHSLTLPHHLQSLLLLSTYWHLLSSTLHITCPMISPIPMPASTYPRYPPLPLYYLRPHTQASLPIPMPIPISTSPSPSLPSHYHGYLPIPMPIPMATSPSPSLPPHSHSYLTIPQPTSPLPQLPHHPQAYLPTPIATSPSPWLPHHPHGYLPTPIATSPSPCLPHHPHGYLTIPMATSPSPQLPIQHHGYLPSPIPTSPAPYLPPLPPFPGMLANSSYSLPRTPDGYLGHCVDGDSLGDSIVPSATLDALQGHLAYRFHLFPCTFHFILV